MNPIQKQFKNEKIFPTGLQFQDYCHPAYDVEHEAQLAIMTLDQLVEFYSDGNLRCGRTLSR